MHAIFAIQNHIHVFMFLRDLHEQQLKNYM